MAEEDSTTHQILREEIFALRYFLGLPPTPSDESPFTAADLNCTPINPTSTSTLTSAIKDVLLLAIDLDYEGEISQTTLIPTQFQFGVSLLDTRHLLPLSSNYSQQPAKPSEINLKDIMTTYNFCYGSPEYYLRAIKRFCFGHTELILTIEEIKTRIESLTWGRDVVLVVHGGYNDLRFLEQLDICFKPVYTLDTQKSAQNLLQLLSRPSLGWLLSALGISHQRGSLHCAGNDAHFTLRALLMIAVRDAEEQGGLDDAQHAMVEVLRGIAKIPIPLNGMKVSNVQGQGSKGRAEVKRRKLERKMERRLVRESENLE